VKCLGSLSHASSDLLSLGEGESSLGPTVTVFLSMHVEDATRNSVSCRMQCVLFVLLVHYKNIR